MSFHDQIPLAVDFRMQLLYHKILRLQKSRPYTRLMFKSNEVYIFNKQIICFRLKALKMNTCKIEQRGHEKNADTHMHQAGQNPLHSIFRIYLLSVWR